MKIRYWKYICTLMFIAALFTSQVMKATYAFINKWMDQEDVHMYTPHTHTHTHTHTGILFTHSHVKGGNPAICENMDRSWGHYAKRDISDRERQILHISYTWNLKKPNSQKQDNGDYQGLGWGKLGRCCLRVQTCN